MEKRITSKDVAKRAGVSQATVSYVLNNTSNQSISLQTRQKVLQVAEELHYYPDKTARRLRNQRTNCITIVMEKEISHPRYAETLQAIRDEMERHGYRMLLSRPNSPSSFHGLPTHLQDYMEKQVDGILYVSADGESPDSLTLQEVKKHSIPFVAVDAMVEDPDIGTVDVDYGYGMKLAAEILLERGCRRFLYLRPDWETMQEKKRLFMLEQLEKERKIPVLVKMCSTKSEESILGEMDQIAQEASEGTGVIVSWQSHFSAVLGYFLMKNIKVPLAGLAAPSLNSWIYEQIYQSQTGAPVIHLGLPTQEIGCAGVKMLLKLIQDPSAVKKIVYRPHEVPLEKDG